MYSNDLQSQLANSPFVKKLRNYLLLFILVEIALFVLLCFLTDFAITAAITIGFLFVGYSIKPMNAPKLTQSVPSANMLNDFRQVRNIVGILFMIPGFLTDIAGILLLIPFTRKALVSIGKKIADRKIKKLTGGLGLDPSMIERFKQMGMGANGMGGFGGMGANGFGGFGDMGANGFGAQANPSASKGPTSAQAAAEAARRSKKQRHKQHDTVDVDYEIKDEDGVWIGGKSESPTDLVVAMKHAKRPETETPDVIDVEAEWKS
jgi:UPF0716 family protein affecting phage T7 exclusion